MCLVELELEERWVASRLERGTPQVVSLYLIELLQELLAVLAVWEGVLEEQLGVLLEVSD